MTINKTNSDTRTIIFYDGVCNLCNGLVQFILKRDKQRRFRFVAIQSQTGTDILKRFKISTEAVRTIIVIDGNAIYFKSRAIFKILDDIGGFWKFLLIFSILPVKFNDYIYDIIAKNRYKIFGKNKECVILE